MGAQRATAYYAYRLGRMRETPHRIAAGFAAGAAISVTPFIGFHLAGALLGALITRGSYVAALVGTVVGNPWTFPFFFAWDFWLGRKLLGYRGPYDVEAALPRVGDLVDKVWALGLGKAEWTQVGGDVLALFWPMALGGLVTMIPVWFLTYLLLLRPVASFQEARRRRLNRNGRQPATLETESP